MTQSRLTITDKRQAFRKLHESGCFIIPNPWDVGSAVYLQSLGFKALATTSSGLAWAQGRPDNGLPRERVLEHLREMVDATDLPLNADFENGFAVDAAAVGESVRLAVASGVAGLSIEDSTGRADAPLFELDDAVARLRAAREAIDAGGTGTLLVGRAECFIVGRPDLAETIARLRAYANAGADCLYAPGLRTVDQIRAVVDAVHPKPVNVLMGSPGGPGLTALSQLGVRRVSVGGALSRAAWGGFMSAAQALIRQGNLDGLAAMPTHDDLDALFQPRETPAR
jgi:2-methylisocitrate lyase-like PEP mutase family enzyme